MKKKTFHIHLRDNREAHIVAETYRHEGQQYVFDGTESGEVEFFKDEEVIGITVVTPQPDVPGRGW